MEKLRMVLSPSKTLEDVAATASASLCVLPGEDLGASRPVVSAPRGFVAPRPRPLRCTGDVLTLLSSTVAVLVRLCAGCFVSGWRPRLSLRPPRTEGAYALRLFPFCYLSDSSRVLRGELPRPLGKLTLYEFDSSPFCRKVRDAATQLDLTLEIRPCPGAGHAPPTFFGDEHEQLHGRRTVPFLVDEGKGLGLFESEEIVSHLYDAYGPGAAAAPFTLRGAFALGSAGTAAILRGMPADKLQVDARPDNHLMKPLVLYGYEGSPFSRPVREKLCALGLRHTLVPCGRGSANRATLANSTGRQFQVPHLQDPNTGAELSESIEIRVYLDRVYTTSGYTPLRGGSYYEQ